MNKWYDVVVVGGGVSGSVAAIAAARTGARTLLVEKFGFLGGTLTGAGVGPMMTFHAGNRQVIGGIPQEIVKRLMKMGASPGHIPDTTGFVSTVTPFDDEALKYLLQEMALECMVNFIFYSVLASVKMDGCTIKAIEMLNKGGLSEIIADIYIDATGDADLAVKCGVQYQKGRPGDNISQPMTMMLRVGNVDIKKIKANVLKNPENFCMINSQKEIIEAKRLSVNGFLSEIKTAKQKGEITFERDRVLFFETNTPGEVIVNMTRVLNADATNPEDLTMAEIEGRRQAWQLFSFLKKYIPGFENAIFISTGPCIGIRESRKIKGEYVLTAEDLIECRRFEDVIAKGSYPVDIHSPDGAGMQYMKLKEGTDYDISFRSLYAQEVDNLLVCGRCISSTHEANAAIRVSPIAMATGQAAGTAAALCVKKNVIPKNLDVQELQNLLRSNGVIL